MNYFHYFLKEVLNSSSIKLVFWEHKEEGGEEKNSNFLFTKNYLKISILFWVCIKESRTCNG